VSHWLDDTARNLAEGRYNRRQVLRRGGAVLAGGLVGTLASPLQAFGRSRTTARRCGVHTCKPGQACCDDEYCYDPATHKCCGKGNICARGDSCCGNHCCHAGANEHCCGGEVCCRKGQTCCGIPGSVANPVGCCDAGRHCCHSTVGGEVVFGCCPDRTTCCGKHCCDSATQKCCGGRCYDPVTDKCCGETICPMHRNCCGDKCCQFHLVCCGGTCCHKANCHNNVCRTTPKPKNQLCPEGYTFCNNTPNGPHCCPKGSFCCTTTPGVCYTKPQACCHNKAIYDPKVTFCCPNGHVCLHGTKCCAQGCGNPNC
jgi:hypothetical protein